MLISGGFMPTIRLMPEGRKCEFPECHASLSRYNQGKMCQSHFEEKDARPLLEDVQQNWMFGDRRWGNSPAVRAGG
jgi:hypothetical protein